MGATFGAILAKIAVGILQALMARKDLKDSVRKTIKLEAAKLALEAHEYKAWAIEHPDLAGKLPDAGGRIRLV